MTPKIRNARWFLIVAAIVAALFVLNSALFTRAMGDDKQKKQAKVLEMKDKALADLAKDKPETSAEIKNAPGYAVFDNNGMHLLLFATSRGNGVVISNGGEAPFFMKMKQIGAGPGIGVKDYRVIFIFRSAEVMNKFKSGGWDATAEADAAAKTKDSGGAASATGSSVAAGADTKVYTITKKGVALQATFGGTKFVKNDDLN